MLEKKRKRCDYENCEYSSAYAGHFKIHKRTHTGEKPYKCDYENCGYSCAQAGNLNAHKKRKHTGACNLKAHKKRKIKAQKRKIKAHKHKKRKHGDDDICQYKSYV